MKKIVVLLLLSFILEISVFSQIPKKFNYQAVLRDLNGDVIANKQKNITIEILKENQNGEVVFTENQTVTTTSHGVISIIVGSQNDIGLIDWSANDYFIRITIDGVILGENQILSVPISIHSETATRLKENPVESDPVFTLWDKTSGIIITENQIVDLQDYTLEELDPSLTANFDFSNANTNDILQFNGDKWVKFTPNFLTQYSETDPVFGAWNKSTGITINESQISDLKNYVIAENDPKFFENFDFAGAQPGDILTYNGNKWVKATPQYLIEYTEVQALKDVLELGNDANFKQIKNLSDPSESKDAATKQYVDSKSLPSGSQLGEMMYWDGSQWLTIAPGTYGQQLTFCDGKPVWGFCLPIITTIPVTNNIGSNATSGGIITNNGGSSIIQKGICWNTSPLPTINNNLIIEEYGENNFTITISGLTSGITYYVRAYAISGGGVGYGNEISFVTSIALPSVTTLDVAEVMADHAKCDISINNTGGDAIVAGICWSTNPNPTISDNKTEDITSTGSFRCDLTELAINTTYYVRAYATNSQGTAYGDEFSFTTQNGVVEIYTSEPVETNTTSTKSGGLIYSDGGSPITQRGVCWSTLSNPTIDDDLTNDGEGLYEFTSNIINVTPGTTYYVRAYAINNTGIYYGDEYSFTTLSGIPIITTIEVSNISNFGAESGGIIDDDGGTEVLSRGVCWSTSSNPTIDNSKTENGVGTGTYTSILENLNPSTTYYVRAYSTNIIGVAYGEEKVFTTYDGTPIISTSAISAITSTSFTAGGDVSNDFGSTVIARGICWSTNPNPTIDNNKTEEGNGLGSFTSTGSGLTEWTIYYIRAYATNSYGTGYGDEIKFMANNPVTDFEGNTYKTVKIGTQIWTAENLKSTVLNDGTLINSVHPNASYIWYNSDISYKSFGAYYNGYAAITTKMCPVGWHVPSDTEWTTLTDYLGGTDVAGGKLKEEGILNWTSPNTGATNETLFSAMPLGNADVINIAHFWYFLDRAYFLTSTPINEELNDYLWNRYLEYNSAKIYRSQFSNSEMYEYGSIRCVKD